MLDLFESWSSYFHIWRHPPPFLISQYLDSCALFPAYMFWSVTLGRKKFAVGLHAPCRVNPVLAASGKLAIWACVFCNYGMISHHTCRAGRYRASNYSLAACALLKSTAKRHKSQRTLISSPQESTVWWNNCKRHKWTMTAARRGRRRRVLTWTTQQRNVFGWLWCIWNDAENKIWTKKTFEWQHRTWCATKLCT